VLLISSGHGYLGIRPRTPPHDLLGGLLKAARETGERYFPEKYAEAAASGLEERTCTRPWTPSGLGILETAPTKAGGALVVVAAHNTGGFAQGPAVGNAVVATLTGRAHRMQRLYHPRRDSAFLAHAGEPA
jgi:D-amino-acid dehydrogenase